MALLNRDEAKEWHYGRIISPGEQVARKSETSSRYVVIYAHYACYASIAQYGLAKMGAVLTEETNATWLNCPGITFESRKHQDIHTAKISLLISRKYNRIWVLYPRLRNLWKKTHWQWHRLVSSVAVHLESRSLNFEPSFPLFHSKLRIPYSWI